MGTTQFSLSSMRTQFLHKFFRSIAFNIALLLAFGITVAQEPLIRFSPSNGPFAGEIISLVKHRNQLFALVQNTSAGGVYRSTDAGATWERLTAAPEIANAQRLISTDRTLFLLLNTSNGGGRVFRSVNNGITWERSPTAGGSEQFTHIVEAGADTLVARVLLQSTVPNFYSSTDGGANWQPLSQARNSINSIVWLQSETPVNGLRSAMFGGSAGLGLFRSVNKGGTWQPLASPVGDRTVTVLSIIAAPNGMLLLATNLGVFTSTNAGETWADFTTGLEGAGVQTLALKSENAGVVRLLAGTAAGVFERRLGSSTNADSAWVQLTVPGLPRDEAALTIVLESSQGAFLLGSRRGVFRGTSDNVGILRWEQLNRGLPRLALIANSLAATVSQSSSVLASTQISGVFRLNNGNVWQPTNIGLMLRAGDSLTANIVSEGAFALVSTRRGLFFSTDSGTTWTAARESPQNTEIAALAITTGLQGNARVLYAGAKNGVIFQSNDNGATWRAVQTTFSAQINAFVQISQANASGASVYAATANGLAERMNGGTTNESWAVLPVSRFPRRLTVLSLLQANGIVLAGTSEGVFRSQNAGQTWLQSPTSARFGAVQSLTEQGGTFYAGTATNGVLRSTDNGASWEAVTSPESLADTRRVNALAATSTKLFCATETGMFEASLSPATMLQPVIASLSQDSAVAGSPAITISVNGRNFAQNARVEFGGRSVSAEVQSPSLVRVQLPQTVLADVGEVRLDIINAVQTTGSTATMDFRASTTFRIVEGSRTAPIVFVIQPDSVFANENATITITGRNLARTNVFLGQDEIIPTSLADTRLTAVLPARLLMAMGMRRIDVVNAQTREQGSGSIRVVLRPEPTPRLTLTPSAPDPFRTFLTVPSEAQRLTLTAENVANSLRIVSPLGFQLSLNQLSWTDTLTIPTNADNVIAQTLVFVRFFPRDSGSFSSSISILTARGVLVQRLPVSGMITPLSLQVAPGVAVNFGVARVGTSTEALVRITNPNPLTITLSTSFSGAGVAHFTTNTRQLLLAPNETQIISVLFQPRSRGLQSAQLRLLGAASANLAVAGEGGQAEFVFSQSTAQFSTAAYIQQRTPLPVETLTLRNNGNLDDIVTGVRFDPPDVAALVNFAPFRLAPNASTTITVRLQPQASTLTRVPPIPGASFPLSEFPVETRLTPLTAAQSSTQTIILRGTARILLPPALVRPDEIRLPASMLASTTFDWQWVNDATHYQVALSESAQSQPRSIVATTEQPLTNLRLDAEKAYFWSVRSVKMQGTDTVVVSDWQQRNFFTTYQSTISSEIADNTVLDFGTIPREQGTVSKLYTLPVNSGSLTMSGVQVVDDVDSVFSVAAEDAQRLVSAPLSARVQYPLRVLFSPKSAQSLTPTQHHAMLLLTAEGGKLLPVRLRGNSSTCSAATVGCGTANVRLRILPPNTVFLPGDTMRVRIILAGGINLSSALDPFFRRLSVRLFVDNISLLAMPNVLSRGLPVNTMLPTTFAAYPKQQNGEIRFDVVRTGGAAQQMGDVVLAEMTGVATIGVRNGLGLGSDAALDSAIIRLADVQWSSESGEVPMLPRAAAIMPNYITERATFIVNTCKDSTRSLFLTATTPLGISLLSANPAGERVELAVSIQERGEAEFTIFNTLGQRMKSVFHNEFDAGNYTMSISTEHLPQGSYLLVLRSGDKIVRQRLEVVR